MKAYDGRHNIMMDLSNEMKSMTRSKDLFQVFENCCFLLCYSKSRGTNERIRFLTLSIDSFLEKFDRSNAENCLQEQATLISFLRCVISAITKSKVKKKAPRSTTCRIRERALERKKDKLVASNLLSKD